ncbi:A-kinase anchor protein 13-like [Cuculus canorus]|uniref:A-kinase anchor protein 13-like n=1 Tax=Cuculus canorus TaxID=55661 RepID=UPI0023AA3B60|nr:A-kinase anchor protein 13-like [Cuculus canorus]
MKKRALSPKEGQKEEVREKDPSVRPKVGLPERLPISSKEECRGSGTSSSLPPAMSTKPSTSPERRKKNEMEAWEKELVEKEGRLAQREEQLQRWWQDHERECQELQLEKASFQVKWQSQISGLQEKLIRVPSESGVAESSKEKSPARPQQGHVDSEPSISPERNSLLRTLKEKSPFRSHGTTKQTHQAAEEQPRRQTASSAQPKPRRSRKRGKRDRDS